MKIYRGKIILKRLKKKLVKKYLFIISKKAISWGRSLKSIYFSYNHSYLNYASIAWSNTCITIIRPLPYKQKQVVRIVFKEGRLSHSKILFKILNVLNVYKINLNQHLNFICRLGTSDIPAIFNYIVTKPEHKYPSKF